ncbi:glycoside hydrolase family 3 N-terminal domain-containing protein [Cellulomonas sp. URHE0023]|uniref:glycoside hydrolase family 3 N-terminal domain-containing protein n=1 Tax=Cellulomonas sp. URHE0023 TaxID=1380354 RepID=UPI0006925046|nr:glycoside hydrolase family 3 N-terminal domain-containing protein [Cellulomonas sp. URHE0023]
MDKAWLDAARTPAERAELLLAHMTLAEKVGQLHQPANISAVEHADDLRAGRIGTSLSASGATAGNVRDEGVAVRAVNAVQRIAVEESRLGIPLLMARDVIHGHRTVLPIPLGQAATWDPELVRRGARVAAVEASAVGIGWTFAPMMDITGDHRWGRVAESLGEDPVLAGRLAAATVRGLQTEDLSAPDAIAACAKHYVGYGLAEGGRDYNSVTAGENSLRNLQLRPFHECVRAGVATVMSSFNDIDGVPVHANTRYLREILKDEWGFGGAIVSDWDGVGEIVHHRVAVDAADAARQGIEAGVDIDMVSGSYLAHLEQLVSSGAVATELLDDAVRRVLTLKFRCGLFEHPYTDEGLEARVAGTGEHRSAAREAAAASFVLLKNDGILPFAARSDERILFTGPLLDATDALFGTWTLDGRADEVVSIADALPAFTGPGARSVPWTHSDQVLAAAREVSTVVAFVGEHPVRSGEANSITTLDLPVGQLETLQAIKAVGVRLVVVVLGGRALALTWVAQNADAVLYAWHPGSEGGNAIADVLFGTVGPRGRLPITLPRSAGQQPLVYNHRSTGRPIAPAQDDHWGRYQDSLSTPLYPFGFGLTYGAVAYSDVTVSVGSEVSASVVVTNTGNRACTEVVQVYVRDDVAGVTRPVKELVDWAVVELDPGASHTVRFTIGRDQLGYVGRDGRYRVDPGTFALWVAPDSASGDPVSFELD